MNTGLEATPNDIPQELEWIRSYTSQPIRINTADRVVPAVGVVVAAVLGGVFG
jgi:hypothetical protein